MLHHGTPWQAALGYAFATTIIFVVAMALSLVSGYLGWYSIMTALFLALGFGAIVLILPTLMNLSRSFFGFVFLLLIVQIAVTITSFAFHYMSSGLIANAERHFPDFREAVYFSITTFTTLGYGDLQPVPEERLTTSIEALSGMVSMAIGASLIWLWCQENMIPKEMALFDGNRRHKTQLGVTRIRIRTLTGKERVLKDWHPPPDVGESYYYDEKRQEWRKVTKETELAENALVMGLQERDPE